jgi:hypothetical protein
MTNRLLRLCLFLAALAAGVGLFPSGLRAADGKPDPKAQATSEAATDSNQHQSGDKKDGLKELEDDLFKPMKRTFSPKGSLEGVLLVPPQTRNSNRTVPQTKKEKELEQERKEWVFISADELTAEPTMEEIFNIREYGPDGLEKKKLSPMERYVERMEARSNGGTNSNKGRDSNRRGAGNQTAARKDLDIPEDSKQPKKGEESLDRIQKLFSASAEKTALPGTEHHGTLSDIFGLGENKPSAEWTKAQKGRLEEFKQIIGFTPTPVFNSDSFSAAHGMGDPLPKSPSPSWASSRMNWDQWGKINPTPAPGGIPDFSSKGYGQPSFGPAPPAKVEQFNLAPPTPNFNAPRRPF